MSTIKRLIHRKNASSWGTRLGDCFSPHLTLSQAPSVGNIQAMVCCHARLPMLGTSTPIWPAQLTSATEANRERQRQEENLGDRKHPPTKKTKKNEKKKENEPLYPHTNISIQIVASAWKWIPLPLAASRERDTLGDSIYLYTPILPYHSVCIGCPLNRGCI